MKVFEVRNVSEALPKVIEYLVYQGRRETSRNGDVFVAETPTCIVYNQPTEKVLFSPLRDANPFFHLLESIWMLSGCNDAKFLNYYVKDFGDRYGETPTGRLFIHVPDRSDIQKDLRDTGFLLERDVMRSKVCDESKLVKDFSDECRFWVARKPESSD